MFIGIAQITEKSHYTSVKFKLILKHATLHLTSHVCS